MKKHLFLRKPTINYYLLLLLFGVNFALILAPPANALSQGDAAFRSGTASRAVPPEVSPPAAAVPFTMAKTGTSILFRFEWLVDATMYHIYGLTDEASMDSGAYSSKICDLENNGDGTWQTDGSTYVEWTLTDASLLPLENFVVIAENVDGEGPYGSKSGGSPRAVDADGTTPGDLGCGIVCDDITINELDSDTPGIDSEEFVELHNATGSDVDMNAGGYVLAFFNGSNNNSYLALDLVGTISTDGYYLIGNSGVVPGPDQTFSDDTLQNGADAVALYSGAGCSQLDIPNGTAAAQTIGNCSLIDALCYDTSDPDATGLMTALGQTEQINENEFGNGDSESIQRNLDSQGCPQGWAGNWKIFSPTTGITNNPCAAITASLDSVTPDTTVCEGTQQTFTGSGTGEGVLIYDWDFDYVEPNFDIMATNPSVNYTYPQYGLYIAALRVTDECANPTIQTAIDSVQISIKSCNCSTITINEIDSDQTSTDTLEFVELHNATGSSVDLMTDGYVLVFYNGFSNQSYLSMDLTGSIPSDDYYLLGNTGVSPAPDQTFADDTLQNGPDGVALYNGTGCSASLIPNGTFAAQTIGNCTLVDAICYDTNDDDAILLMNSLGITEQLNEDQDTGSGSDMELHSIQRITDSIGCSMNWVSPYWKATTPTPAAIND